MAGHYSVTASSMARSPILRGNITETSVVDHSEVRKSPAILLHGALVAMALLFCSCASAIACHAQSLEVVCKNGTGDFEAVFQTGVELRVGATRNGELATRACDGALESERQRLVVASGVAQIDVDAFGVDLGLGVPIAAIQVKKTSEECCMEYRIYSLKKPSRLLRKIDGGSYFSAADTDLDGRVEIWTDDAAAVDGFEHIPLSALDFAPPLVLRFEHGKLLDVSAEFRGDYHQRIETLRASLDAGDLREFKESDGVLAPGVTFSQGAQHLRERLQTVKIKVLEIAWSYLYGGEEAEALRTLADLWPAGDAARIRGALWSVRERGILRQTEGASKGVPGGGKTETRIYEGLIGLGTKPEVSVLPQPILLRRPPPEGAAAEILAATEVRLVLVVDAAGKVRSAKPEDTAEWTDAGLRASVANWKFIPALKNGRAVASRIGYAVSLQR